MINAREAYNISFVNDECKEYLDKIEQKILEAAGVGRYNVSIELSARGLALSDDEIREITIAIVSYLRSFGYHASVSKHERHATLLISWIKPYIRTGGLK